MATDINAALMRLQKRAEATDPAVLVETFVDTGTLVAQLTSRNHQIVYGRRGTGKTHLLHFLAAHAAGRNEMPCYIDLRTIGSSGGVYADPTAPISERGSRLLVDALSFVHDRLTDLVLTHAEAFATNNDFKAACDSLDQLAAAITHTRVIGEVEREQHSTLTTERTSSTDASAGISSSGPGFTIGGRSAQTASAADDQRVLEKGTTAHRVRFGAVAVALERLATTLPGKHIWLLFDEWSSIPSELQPLLAEMLKRCVLPARGVTVKIAAIEQRSRFRVNAEGVDLGIELGADMSADVDLDDFMVFGNDAARARSFFRDLLYKHVRAQLTAEGLQSSSPGDAAAFLQRAFTQHNAFDELVRAAEGVPRDAINVIAIAAQQADDRPVAIADVRNAARAWYARDKATAVEANPDALNLLHWIIDKVIRHRRARAFLLQQGEPTRHPLIGTLYDARVLHLLKRGISSRDHAGLRFNVYGLDYGCYVDLMTTASAPRGLLPADTVGDVDAGFIEVPPDDYRAIRRAILEVSDFEHGADPLADEEADDAAR